MHPEPVRALRLAASRHGDPALGVACAVMLLAEYAGTAGHGDARLLAGGALSVLAGGAVAVRRRRPAVFLAAVVAVTWAAVAGLVPRVEGGLGWAAVGMIALYTVAASPPPTRRVGAPLAIALPAGWIAADATHVHLDAGTVIGYGLFAAAPWFFGHAIGRRREREHGLERRAELLRTGAEHLAQRAVAEERVRIAREIHDVVGHALGVIVVQADGAHRLLTTDPDESGRALATIGRTGREALQEMRRLVGLLRTSEEGEGLGPAPGVAQLQSLADQMGVAGLPVEVTVEGVVAPLPASVDVSAFRIAQEALTNVLRHAGPARARVVLRYREDAIEVSILDDGRGDTAGGDAGHGLIGIRERVAAFGGEVEAGPRPAGGYLVRALLPYGARA